ncbi:hypothetical protein ACVIG9_004357 [Bradyrhizobium ottawaense]
MRRGSRSALVDVSMTRWREHPSPLETAPTSTSSGEALDNHHQDLFAADISNGQRRLKELASTIAHLKFVKTAMLTRFPNFKPPQLNS